MDRCWLLYWEVCCNSQSTLLLQTIPNTACNSLFFLNLYEYLEDLIIPPGYGIS